MEHLLDPGRGRLGLLFVAAVQPAASIAIRIAARKEAPERPAAPTPSASTRSFSACDRASALLVRGASSIFGQIVA